MAKKKDKKKNLKKNDNKEKTKKKKLQKKKASSKKEGKKKEGKKKGLKKKIILRKKKEKAKKEKGKVKKSKISREKTKVRSTTAGKSPDAIPATEKFTDHSSKYNVRDAVSKLRGLENLENVKVFTAGEKRLTIIKALKPVIARLEKQEN